MLNIRLEIENIDYEATIENLLPQLVETVSQKEDQGEINKFLTRLGPDMIPVAKKLLGYLDDTTRVRIAVWLIESNGDQLAELTNRVLAEQMPGALIIGAFHAEELPGAKLALMAQQVNVDYPALLNSPLLISSIDSLGPMKAPARLIMQMGSIMPAETLEKQGVTLLRSDLVKPKLLAAISDALRSAGVIMTFRNMTLESSNFIELPDRKEAKDEGLIPDVFEDALIDAFVALLKDLIR